MDIKELGQLDGPPEDHWYYASKFALLSNAVEALGARHVVDIGAGSGVFSRLLLERTGCASALCVDPAYEVEEDVEIGGKLLRFRRQYDGSPVDLASGSLIACTPAIRQALVAGLAACLPLRGASYGAPELDGGCQMPTP